MGNLLIAEEHLIDLSIEGHEVRIALVLMPIASLLGPGAPDQPFIARLIGGLMPGLVVVVVGVVLGALGGLLLGYAAKHGNYP